MNTASDAKVGELSPFGRSFKVLTALLILASAWCAPAVAEEDAVSEYAVKSALLFKLPNFVYSSEAEQKSAFSMCVIGTNPFGAALEKLAQTPLSGRPVKVLHLVASSDVGECSLAFISRSEATNLRTILRRFSNSTTLTVSDIEGFAEADGMVEFGLGGNGSTVSIVINRRAAQRQKIDFNAQLLRLSRVVE